MKRVAVLVLVAAMSLMGLSGCGQTEPAEESDFSEIEVEELFEDTEEVAGEIIPDIKTITISATGDCTLGKAQIHDYDGTFYAFYDRYGADYFMDKVRSIFTEDDFTIVNLECVLSNSEDIVEKTFNLKGKPEYVKVMTGSSIEGCSLGNNHTRDYSESGLIDTQNLLDENNIIYGYQDHVGTYTTEDGLVIGVVSSNLLTESADRENYIRDGIAQLKEEGADLIIACCHWGIEKEYYPNSYQEEAAHRIVDWGADVVIGSHPHVLQGMEIYKGKVICYSLGNFCFGGNTNPSDKNTMIYQQTFTFENGILQDDLDARIIPCALSGHDGYNDYQPNLAGPERKASIIAKINKYSESYKGFYIDDEGVLTLGEPAADDENSDAVSEEADESTEEDTQE